MTKKAVSLFRAALAEMATAKVRQLREPVSEILRRINYESVMSGRQLV
jgi:hypothetical protein